MWLPWGSDSTTGTAGQPLWGWPGAGSPPNGRMSRAGRRMSWCWGPPFSGTLDRALRSHMGIWRKGARAAPTVGVVWIGKRPRAWVVATDKGGTPGAMAQPPDRKGLSGERTPGPPTTGSPPTSRYVSVSSRECRLTWVLPSTNTRACVCSAEMHSGRGRRTGQGRRRQPASRTGV